VFLVIGAIVIAVLLLAWHALREHVDADAPGTIEIDYVGNPNGVYHARCSRVSTAPPGHIVELDAGDTIIDATSEYLPDGLEVHGPGSKTTAYDCHDFLVDAVPGPPPTTPPTSTTAAPTPSLSS
jgi:hypothetical protein